MAESGITPGNFWTDLSLEPKRKFKFYVDLSPLSPTIGQGDAVLQYWQCKSITKPSFTVAETPHKILNHTFYYPGKVEWNAVEATLVDPGGNFDTSKALVENIRRAGYIYPDRGQTFMLTKKALSVDSLKIYQFISHHEANLEAATEGKDIHPQVAKDGKDQLLEVWTLRNAWVQDVNFGDLAYDSEDMVEISLTLRYDWAEIQNFPNNVVPDTTLF